MQRGQEEARRRRYTILSIVLLIGIGFTYLIAHSDPATMSMNRVVKRMSCQHHTLAAPSAIKPSNPFESGLPITFPISQVLLAAASIALLSLRSDGRRRQGNRWRHLQDLAWLWAKSVPFGSDQQLPYFRAERAH